MDGIAVACVGDKATCPTHKIVATIVSGDPNMQIFYSGLFLKCFNANRYVYVAIYCMGRTAT
ncbi:PAAR domain-containing protein [Acinetobacter pittii]|nr:PAAR domain-containing protein [Acinetobacter pittii]